MLQNLFTSSKVFLRKVKMRHVSLLIRIRFDAASSFTDAYPTHSEPTHCKNLTLREECPVSLTLGVWWQDDTSLWSFQIAHLPVNGADPPPAHTGYHQISLTQAHCNEVSRIQTGECFYVMQPSFQWTIISPWTAPSALFRLLYIYISTELSPLGQRRGFVLCLHTVIDHKSGKVTFRPVPWLIPPVLSFTVLQVTAADKPAGCLRARAEEKNTPHRTAAYTINCQITVDWKQENHIWEDLKDNQLDKSWFSYSRRLTIG